MWRNEFSKINFLFHHISNQRLIDSNDFKYINPFLSHKINPFCTRETNNNRSCENHGNQEIKCGACCSTNLIKISDYNKAILFLGNVKKTSNREKYTHGLVEEKEIN